MPNDGRLKLSYGLVTFSVFLRGKGGWSLTKTAKGAFVSESALHSFDGDKPNSVGPESIRGRMIIYLSRISPRARPAFAGHGATIPEELSGRLPFLCFVLHRMGFFVPRELLRER